MPLIENVLGRTGCMIRTPHGTLDSTALTTSFYFFKSIRRYQFIQKDIRTILLNVIAPDNAQWEAESAALKSKLQTLLGDGVDIQLNKVEDILPSPSGKHMYFINEMGK